MESPKSLPPDDVRKKSTWEEVIRAVSKSQDGQTRRQQRNRRGSHWSTVNMDSFIARYTTQRTSPCAAAAAAASKQCEGEEDDDDDDEETVFADIEKGNDFETCHYFVIDPDGTLIFYWLLLVAIAVIYNLWLPLNRFAWQTFDQFCYALWITMDCLFDLVYLADIFVQSRTAYMEHGLLVRDGQLLARQYFKSRYFLFDLLSIIPVNLLYRIFSGNVFSPILRFPRVLKIYRARQFAFKAEAASSHPNLFRILNFIHLLLLVIHLVATGFCIVSRNLNFSTDLTSGNHTVEDSVLEYLNAVYWSTVTLTAIGDVPTPVSIEQYLIQILGFFFGIFVFATIVGQVGAVVNQRNKRRMEFERLVDNAKKYMREHQVPKEVQKSILGWYEYTWTRGKSVRQNDDECFEMLPTKLRTELAIYVNLETLKKVSFFQECEPEFLHDLVLRMQLVITTPGELVCRKGEIAREMFIISDGVLEVLNDDDTVIRTLQAGDFFGETGLLVTETGSNRRTTDVRSVGYSDLFVVTKQDAVTLLEDYPETKKAVHDRAQFYMAQDDLRRIDLSLPKNGYSKESKKPTFSYKDRMGRSLTMHRSVRRCVKSLPRQTGNYSFAGTSFTRRWSNATDESATDDSGGDQECGGKFMNNKDIAREVMTSIEDVLFNKLSKVSKDYNRLYSRFEAVQEELEKKTDELNKITGDH